MWSLSLSLLSFEPPSMLHIIRIALSKDASLSSSNQNRSWHYPLSYWKKIKKLLQLSQIQNLLEVVLQSQTIHAMVRIRTKESTAFFQSSLLTHVIPLYSSRDDGSLNYADFLNKMSSQPPRKFGKTLPRSFLPSVDIISPSLYLALDPK